MSGTGEGPEPYRTMVLTRRARGIDAARRPRDTRGRFA